MTNTRIKEDQAMTEPVWAEAVKIMKSSMKVNANTENLAIAIPITMTTTMVEVMIIALNPYFYLYIEIDLTCLAAIRTYHYPLFKVAGELPRSTGKS